MLAQETFVNKHIIINTHHAQTHINIYEMKIISIYSNTFIYCLLHIHIFAFHVERKIQ